MNDLFKKIIEKINEDKKLGSILIRDNFFYLNYHEEDKIISYCFDKEGNLLNEEKLDEIKKLNEKEIIKKEELNLDFSEIKDTNYLVITKKDGVLEVVTFNIPKQQINRYKREGNKLKMVEKLDFTSLSNL